MSLIDWKNIAIEITRRTRDLITARYVNRKTGSLYPVPGPAKFVDDGKERIAVEVDANPSYPMRRQDFPDIGETARFATGLLSDADNLAYTPEAGTLGYSYAIERAACRDGNQFQLWRCWHNGTGIMMTQLDRERCQHAPGCECCREKLEEKFDAMKCAFVQAWDRGNPTPAGIGGKAVDEWLPVLRAEGKTPSIQFVEWEMAGQPHTWTADDSFRAQLELDTWPRQEPGPEGNEALKVTAPPDPFSPP